MARVNYKQVQERFSHIDASFVSCELTLPDRQSYFRVSFYPWWENPGYLGARVSGKRGRFADASDEGNRDVTVYPIEMLKASISHSSEVIDWEFLEDHPLLWTWDSECQIMCNTPLTVERWMQILDAARAKLSGYASYPGQREYDSIRKVYRWGKTSPFSLGEFPRPLFLAIRDVLRELKIPFLANVEPPQNQLPVLFLIDGHDYIIARDFELEVPEFIHCPEWFQLD